MCRSCRPWTEKNRHTHRLTEYVKGFGLDDLGLSEGHQKLLLDAARKTLWNDPGGQWFETGKTTTLYGARHLLNEPEINITTIEDPVKYKF